MIQLSNYYPIFVATVETATLKHFCIPGSKFRYGSCSYHNSISIDSQSAQERCCRRNSKVLFNKVPSHMESALTFASHSLSLSRNSVPSTSLNTKITPVSSFSFANFALTKQFSLKKPLVSRQNCLIKVRASTDDAINVNEDQDDDFILEDVPHLTNFLPDLPVLFQY